MSPTVWAVLPGGLWGLWLPAQEVAQGGSPAAQGVVRRHEPRKQAQRGHCKTNRDSTIPPARRAPSRRTAAPGVPWASSPASTLPAPTGGTGCERGTALSRSARMRSPARIPGEQPLGRRRVSPAAVPASGTRTTQQLLSKRRSLASYQTRLM